jgi:hypothetical protein
MEFLVVINKILSLRIVQYALLISVISLTVLSGVQTVRLKFSQQATKSAIQEREQAKAAIIMQNASIDALKAAGESRVKDMKLAVASAQTLAANWQVKAQGLQKKLSGLSKTDCQAAVDGFIALIPEIIGGTQ